GRDHWARSMSAVLAGGGVKRGYAHGSTDANGMAPSVDPCTPHDLSATPFPCLGLHPPQELTTATGPPLQPFREGQVGNNVVAWFAAATGCLSDPEAPARDLETPLLALRAFSRRSAPLLLVLVLVLGRRPPGRRRRGRAGRRLGRLRRRAGGCPRPAWPRPG